MGIALPGNVPRDRRDAADRGGKRTRLGRAGDLERPLRAIWGLSHEWPVGTFVMHFVGPLCRKWPETARFDKVFDKGSRQSGLNRWFWDKLYLYPARGHTRFGLRSVQGGLLNPPCR